MSYTIGKDQTTQAFEIWDTFSQKYGVNACGKPEVQLVVTGKKEQNFARLRQVEGANYVISVQTDSVENVKSWSCQVKASFPKYGISKQFSFGITISKTNTPPYFFKHQQDSSLPDI